MTKLALVRIRGVRGVKPAIAKTFELLGLDAPNKCILANDTPQMKGMIEKVKDYIAFGEVDEHTIASLLAKRGMRGSKKLSEVASAEEIEKVAKDIAAGGKPPEGFVNKIFRLKPPRGGFKAIKMIYPRGDAGYRDDMPDLIRRMK